MSNIYTFRKPLDAMRQLASALTVRNCIVSGSGTDATCSAYVFSEIVPSVFSRIRLQDFRNVDSMISSLAPSFCDSNGVGWTMQKLESACSASDVQPGVTNNPLPAEWLKQRFDMLSRLNIAGGGVQTLNIDGFGESNISYASALKAAISAASAGGTYEDFQAMRDLTFEEAGDYYASATLTVSGIALSPSETTVWGNPRRVFRMSAYQDVYDNFYAGQVVCNGGTMTVVEGVNIFDAGTVGSYRFLDPVGTFTSGNYGMREYTGSSFPVLLYYDL